MFHHCQRCDLSAFMKIIKHIRNDWFRYGFETIAVVVASLVAFALDNWNDDRKQDLLEVGNAVRNYIKLPLPKSFKMDWN